MIRSLLLALLTGPAQAAEEEIPSSGADAEEEEEATTEEQDEDVLAPYRTPFPVLAERAIGTASRAVEFNWRRTTVHLAATGSHFFELNNFDSLRAGGMIRAPVDRFIVEFGASYVWVWDTQSSNLLALTPYRQPGRPPRVEFEVTAGFPVAEGVVTTFPRLFPAAELVFSAYAGLRYVLYPMTFQDMKVREVAAALASPVMTQDELDNLEGRRLDAMEVDPARYGLMIGFGNEIYFRQGLFVMPRAMFSLPIFAPVTESDLLFWADLSLSVGVAF